MSGDVSAAIFGLVGVGVGGVITFGTTAYGLRHQERAAASAARREDARRAQIAARLVYMDVGQVISRLNLAVEKRKTWSPRFALPLSAWEGHKETLALHLALPDWTVLAKCFQAVARLEAQAEGARASNDTPRSAMSDFRIEQASLGIDRATQAVAVLEQFLTDGARTAQWDDLVSEEDDSIAN